MAKRTPQKVVRKNGGAVVNNKNKRRVGGANNINRKKIQGGIKKRPITTKTTPTKIRDARQNIIQKKRQTVKDARDVLAKMAKTQDARNKLNKLRQTRGTVTTPRGDNIKKIGQNIVQKTDRNGKISLVTNKNKQASSSMGATIKKQLGLVTSPMKKSAGVLKQRQTQNRATLQQQRQQVLTEIVPTYNHVAMHQQGYDPSLYKWANQDQMDGGRMMASQLINQLGQRKRIARNEMLQSWQSYPINSPLLTPTASSYMDIDDEEMSMVPMMRQTILQGPSRISNIHSRLDNLPTHQPETHGILSQQQTKTKVVVPAGHRIVVSNLQSTVTQDDVKELFEDIGQLLAARLVRPGVAEVIYKKLPDAQKAVDTYHNRQLDGQPMKCLLVNKRPANNPTAPPLHMDSRGILRSVDAKPAISNKLVPDIQTIHKVLFHRK